MRIRTAAFVVSAGAWGLLGLGPSSTLAQAPDPVVPLEPWAQVLVDEMEAMDEAAASIGAVQTHDPVVEMLYQGATHVIEYEFTTAGVEIAFVGVCDIDCTDLDIGVYDVDGNEIAADAASDDRPEVNLQIDEPGVLEVRVFMVGCSVEPCGFAVQAYQLASAGPGPAAKKN